MNDDQLSPERRESLRSSLLHDIKCCDGECPICMDCKTGLALLDYFERNEADHKAALEVVLKGPEKKERGEDEQHPQDAQNDSEHQ